MSAPPHCSERAGAPPSKRDVHAAAAWSARNAREFPDAPVARDRLCGLKSLCDIVAADVRRRTAHAQNAKQSASSRRRLHRHDGWFTQALKAALRPHSAIPPRLAAALTLAFLLLATLTFSTRAAEPWETALARMPLATGTRELNGTNFGPTLLDAFQSNAVVKALVLMPGAIDEFYFFRRARAQLPSAPTLLDAVRALENQTRIRAAFRPPCLLLHAPPDPLTPAIRVTDEATADRLHTRRFPDPLNFFDRDWPRLQSLLTRTFTSIWSGYPEIVPAAQSPDSWHFYRASIRAWNLTPREGLEALTLATRTAVTIEKRRLVFECDPRAAAPAAPPNCP